MAADIIKVDFKAKTRQPEQQPIEITDVVLIPSPGDGIDGLPIYESSIGWFDPIPFFAPDKDPA